VLSTLLIFINL